MDALGKMADSELDLFEEAIKIRECGHTEEQIATMMGERWKPFQEAAVHFEDEHQELVKEYGRHQ